MSGGLGRGDMTTGVVLLENYFHLPTALTVIWGIHVEENADMPQLFGEAEQGCCSCVPEFSAFLPRTLSLPLPMPLLLNTNCKVVYLA